MAEYIIRFWKYSNIIKQEDNSFITMFRRWLKDNVKDEFIKDRRRIDFLERLVKVVTNLDDKLYERVIEKYYNNSRSRAETYIRYLEYRREGSTRF